MTSLLALFFQKSRLTLETFLMARKEWSGTAAHMADLLDANEDDVAELLREAQNDLRQCQSLNVFAIAPGDPEYPQGFYQMYRPPFFLTYRGNRDLLAKNSLSIVGARRSQTWVEQWMDREVGDWVESEAKLVVSGGAYGVDQRAHRIALRRGGKSIAVLPCGLEDLYPKNLRNFDAYLGSGDFGFFSEYLPNVPMRKHHFFRRNQLIAAMSSDLFVVQAHIKSGSMMTAQYGIQQGKNIFTLPGAPGDPAFSGNLQLLYDGAGLIRSAADLRLI